MNQIRIDNLKEGMIFDDDVFIEEGMIFLPKGKSIRKNDLSRIRKIGIQVVKTAGHPLLASEVKKQEQQAVYNLLTKPNDDVLNKKYVRIVTIVEKIFENIKAETSVSILEIDEVVGDLLNLIGEYEKDVMHVVFCSDYQKFSLAKSAVDCSIMSVILGVSLHLNREDIVRLATGAVLHDIGMIKIPESILRKTGDLTETELNLIKTHPVHSYNIVKNVLGYSDEVSLASLEHHERWDGEGYPKHFKADQITLLARIISITDAFEAMINERPYRGAIVGYSAMKNLLSDNSRRFDPILLKLLIKNIGIYPIGSIVLLNNSSIARVVASNSEAPLRPVLKVLIDEKGREYVNKKSPRLDLMIEKNVFIVKAVHLKELLKKGEK